MQLVNERLTYLVLVRMCPALVFAFLIRVLAVAEYFRFSLNGA